MKILIVRFSSIGDIVLTTPVIRCLKLQRNPEIHYLTFRHFRQVLANNPHIDRLITIDRSIREVIPELRKQRYDLIIDLHRNIRTFSLKGALRRPFTTFRKLNVRKYLLVNLGMNLMPDIHIVDRYFGAVRKLGVVNDGKRLDYFLSPEDMHAVQQLPPAFQQGYVAAVTGGRYTTKIYPAPLMAEVLKQLKMPAVILGGTEDVERGEEICALNGNEMTFNGCGKLPLNHSAAIIAGASLVITNDTGLMHIAAAFGKNIISIWGNTVPVFGMYPYLPEKLKDRSVIIENKTVTCRPCSKLGFSKCPKNHFDCMLTISPEVVVEKALQLAGAADHR